MNGCKDKSISDLIAENRALNLNTPLIICPKDISSSNPIVEFSIITAPGFKFVSSHESGAFFFPYGKTTKVSAVASNTINIEAKCTFGVSIEPDSVAPTLTCPKDI